VREVVEIFRFIGYLNDGKYYLICLDVDIVVRGELLTETFRKMDNALTMYLNSFTDAERKFGKHIRKAPFKYFFHYYINSFATVCVKLKMFYGYADAKCEDLSLIAKTNEVWK